MAAKLPYVVAVLAVSAAVATLMPKRAPLQDANTAASPGASENAEPPQDFAARFLAERGQALMKEAREQALTSAREDERERWEEMKRRQIVAAREAQGPLAWQQMQFVEQRARLYESESVDRDWAPRAEAAILEQVAQTGVQVLDLRVECRTSVCRLELLERASDRPIAVPVAVALRQIGELQPTFPRRIESPVGTRATVSYLARR
jgi:hypothetical protein